MSISPGTRALRRAQLRAPPSDSCSIVGVILSFRFASSMVFRVAAWGLVGLAGLGCGDRTGLLVGPERSVVPSGTTTGTSSTSTSASASTFSSAGIALSAATVSSTFITSSASSSDLTATHVIDFVSGTDWAAFRGFGDGTAGITSSAEGPAMGQAVDVCVTATNPPNCPPGALIYGNPPTPWAASAALPQAHWIWSNVDINALGADLQAMVFAQSFAVGAGATGTIQIAADDLAAVFVNGVLVGSTGSVTDYGAASLGQAKPAVFDLTPALPRGATTATILIQVVGQNGPSTFGTACPQGCTYSENPAGVIFAGELRW